MSNSHHDSKSEGGFYKGLVFGAVIGVGLALFLSSDTGKRYAQKARKRVDELLASAPPEDDYEEITSSDLNGEEKPTPSKISPRRFFRKSK